MDFTGFYIWMPHTEYANMEFIGGGGINSEFEMTESNKTFGH